MLETSNLLSSRTSHDSHRTGRLPGTVLGICLLALVLPSQEPAQQLVRPCTAGGPTPEATHRGRPWTNGIMHYVFDANTNSGMRVSMRAAMNVLEAVADVRFQPRVSETNYIQIRNSNGNNSFIGMLGGAQTVNIVNWGFRFIMVHELCHALGFEHEHQRPDRDQFVVVNSQNVDPSFLFAFLRFGFATTYGDYDLDSLMHYGQFAFTINGQQTITVLPPNQPWQSRIGQFDHLSRLDIEGLVVLYGPLIPEPSTIDPNTVPAFGAPSISIQGQSLGGVTAVLLDGNPVPTISSVSSNRIVFPLPSGTAIGTHTVSVVTGTLTVGSLDLSVTSNDPPVLEMQPETLAPAGSSLRLAVHSDAGRMHLVFASFLPGPSVAPGIVNLGIGGNFANLIQVGPILTADPSGATALTRTIPIDMPFATALHFQALVFDLNPLNFPLCNTDPATLIVF